MESYFRYYWFDINRPNNINTNIYRVKSDLSIKAAYTEFVTQLNKWNRYQEDRKYWAWDTLDIDTKNYEV